MPCLFLKLISVCLHRFSADTVGACHLPEQSALLHQVSATSWSVCALWECVNLFHHRLEGWIKVGLLSLWQMDMRTVCPCLTYFFVTKLYWNRLFIAFFNRLWLAAFILDHFPLFTSMWRVGAIQNDGVQMLLSKSWWNNKEDQAEVRGRLPNEHVSVSMAKHHNERWRRCWSWVSLSVTGDKLIGTLLQALLFPTVVQTVPYLRTCNHVPGFKGSLSLHHMFLTDFNQLAILRKCKYQQHYCEKCTNSDLSLFIFPPTCLEHQHLMRSGTSEGTLYCFCALWWRAFEISMFQWQRASCSRWPCRPIPSTGFIAG